MHNFQLTVGEQRWIASYADLPAELRQTAPEDLLAQMRDGFLRLLPNSKLIQSKTARIGGVPGITCLIESKASGRPEFTLKMSGVVVSGQLISFGFISRTDTFVEPEVDKYLATFRIR